MPEQVDSQRTNTSHFFQRSLLAVWIPNASWSQKVSILQDTLPQKWSQMAFLSVILCLPFSRNLEAQIISPLSFTFSPASIHLLFIPFSHFFTISHHILYSLVRCSTQMFNPIFSSLSLSLLLSYIEAERIWKCSLPLSSPHSPLFLISHCGSHQTLWHFLKISQGLFFSDLSELFCLLKPLWTPSSPQLQKVLVLQS